MGGWNGFLIIFGLGCLALLIAALADRRSRKKAESGRPGVDDPDATPEYVTEDQLARASRSVRPQPTSPIPDNALRLPLRLIDARFGSGQDQRSSVAQARVLVCTDAISSIRELLPVLAEASASGVPLVIAAASVDDVTTDTLVANYLAGKLALQVLGDDSLDGAPLVEIATISGATLVTATDLKAGDVTTADLGFLSLSMATADPPQTFVVAGINT